ncbi:MAG: hypothetical protein ACK5NA_03900 [Enterococcus sp.]
MVSFLNNIRNKNKINYFSLRTSISLLFITLFLLISGYYLTSLLRPLSQSSITELDTSWSMYTNNEPETQFSSAYISYVPNVEKNETYTMKQQIIQTKGNEELLIKGNHQWITVKLGSKVLYTSQEQSSNLTSPGLSTILLPLPENYDKQELTIEVSTPYKNFAGILPKVFIGESQEVATYIFSSSIPQLLIMIIALFLGISAFIFAIHQFYKKHTFNWNLLVLSCLSFSIGLFGVSENTLSSFFFQPLLHSQLANIFAILTPILLCTYYSLRMTTYQKHYQKWIILMVVFDGFFLLFSIFSSTELTEWMSIINTFTVFSALLTSFVCLGEVYHKNYFFIFCSPWILFAAINHCSLYIQNALNLQISTINWTDLLFVIILLVLYIYSIIEYVMDFEKAKAQMNFLNTKTELLEADHELLLDHLNELDSAKQQFLKQIESLTLSLPNQQDPQIQLFLRQVTEEVKALKRVAHFSEHRLTNLILASYQRVAEKKSIQIDFHTSLPERLLVSDNDLMTMLLHTLDRAFRETYAIENPHQRRISLNMEIIDAHLVLECTHHAHYEENLFDRGITERLQEQTELDLSALHSLTEKYQGKLSQEKNKQVDQLKVSLPVKSTN